MRTPSGNIPNRLQSVSTAGDGWFFFASFVALCLGVLGSIFYNPKVAHHIGVKLSLVDKVPPKEISKSELRNVVRTASKFYNVPPELIWAVIEVESGFRHDVKSHAGAMGLMQLMPITAQEVRVGDPYDPVQNVYGGTQYLGKLLKRYKGNKNLALAAYNAGPQKVKKYRGIPPYKETRQYVKKVLTVYNREKAASAASL